VPDEHNVLVVGVEHEDLDGNRLGELGEIPSEPRARIVVLEHRLCGIGRGGK